MILEKLEISEIKILLIDDDPDYHTLVADYLESSGHYRYRIDSVMTLSDAVQQLSMNSLHLCLCDYRLGAENGLEILRHARNSQCSVPIIIMTGQGDLAIDVEAMKLGAVDYLPKDQLTPDILQRAVRYAIERKRAEQEQVQIERQLRHAQKMDTIGTLAGGIAHDFNNILTPILCYMSMLIDEPEVPAHSRSDMEEVIRAANRAKDLVQKILTFSRQVEEELVPLDISPIVKEALRLMRMSLPATIEIRSNIVCDLSPVLADPSQIHQVVMNLCTNAYHALESRGSVIDVELSNIFVDGTHASAHPELRQGYYVRLSVSDDGCGMSEETKEKMFEPFYTTKEVGRGTGLGMSVVHGIISKVDGRVVVYSEPEHGTTIHIYLPVVDEVARPDSVEAAPVIGGTEHILVVDDEHMMIRLARRVLEKLGYRVTTYSSSLRALEAFRESPLDYDLLLADFAMPKMNGLLFANEVQKLRPDLPILIMSGFSDAVYRSQDGNNVIQKVKKPFIVHELAAQLREAIEKPQELEDREL